MPKSIAPSENRLAGIFVKFIAIKTTTRAKGMVTAAIKALRGLPRNRISTIHTSPMPSKYGMRDLVYRLLYQVVPVDIGNDSHPQRSELLCSVPQLWHGCLSGLPMDFDT